MFTFSLTMLASQLINGLMLGMVYVCMAIGLSIIFGMIGIVNFTHGILFTLGAYFALMVGKALGYGATLILSPILVGLIAMVLEAVFFRPFYGKPHLLGLLLAFGLALMLEESIRMIWGIRGFPYDIPTFLQGAINLGIIEYSKYRVFLLAMTVLAIIGVWFFLEKTPYGMIIRAASRDAEMVTMLGISSKKVFTLSYALGSLLAAFSGAIVAPLWGIHPAMGSDALMPSFVVVVIGGLGNFWGAVISGILLGEVVSLSIWIWPPMSEAVMYILMGLILLIRPRGLLGEKWKEFE